MWADSLLLAEQQHLVRLMIWAQASLAVGGLMLVLLIWRRNGSALLRHFAIQTAAWGLVSLVIAVVAWRGLEIRAHEGAVRLDRFIWLNIGLDIGYAAVGITLAATGWLAGRRLGPVGAGIAIVIQGVALAGLDYALALSIRR